MWLDATLLSFSSTRTQGEFIIGYCHDPFFLPLHHLEKFYNIKFMKCKNPYEILKENNMLEERKIIQAHICIFLFLLVQPVTYLTVYPPFMPTLPTCKYLTSIKHQGKHDVLDKNAMNNHSATHTSSSTFHPLSCMYQFLKKTSKAII